MGALTLAFAALICAASGQAATDAATAYQSKCASCHGKDGKGNPAMAKAFKLDPAAVSLADEATLGKSDQDLAAVVAKGKGKMPAYGGKIADADIAALVKYSRTLSPAAATIDAAKLYAATCASCHGKDGKGNPGMAKAFKLDNAALDLADEASLAKTDKEHAELTRTGRGKMPGYKGKLSDGEIDALVAYFRSLAAR